MSRIDEDEFADNGWDEVEDDSSYDGRLRLSGLELRRRQEAEYLGFDPDEFDY